MGDLSLGGSTKLPPETHELETVQRFKQACEAAYRTLQGESVEVDPAEIQGYNGEKEQVPGDFGGDGLQNGAILLGSHLPEKDFFCRGLVTDTGEVQVVASRPSDESQNYGVGLFWVEDAAEAIEKIAGKGELLFSSSLKPGEWRTPQLKDSDLEIFQAFKEKCGPAFQRRAQSQGFAELEEYDWRQTQLIADEFGNYTLSAISRVLNYTCNTQANVRDGIVVSLEGVANDPAILTSDQLFPGLPETPPDPTLPEEKPSLEQWSPEELCLQAQELGLAEYTNCVQPDFWGSGMVSFFGDIEVPGAILTGYLIYKNLHLIASLFTPVVQSLGLNRMASFLSRGWTPLFFSFRPGTTATVLNRTGQAVKISPRISALARNFSQSRLGRYFEMGTLAYLGGSAYQMVEDILFPKQYDPEHKGVVKEATTLGLTKRDWVVAATLTVLSVAQYQALKHGSRAVVANTLLAQVSGFKPAAAAVLRVGMVDMVYGWLRDDYKKWLDHRVKTEFFRRKVYTLDDVTPDVDGAFALGEKGTRIVFNNLAENMWDMATASDQEAIYNEIREEDRALARGLMQSMRGHLAAYMAYSGVNAGDLTVEALNEVSEVSATRGVVGAMVLKGEGDKVPSFTLQLDSIREIDEEGKAEAMAWAAQVEFHKLAALAAGSIIPELAWAEDMFDEDTGEVELDQEEIKQLIVNLYGSEAIAQQYIEAERNANRWDLEYREKQSNRPETLWDISEADITNGQVEITHQ